MKKLYASALTAIALSAVGFAENPNYGFQGTVVQQDGINIQTVSNFGVVSVEDAIFATQYYGARSDLPLSMELTSHNNYAVWKITYTDTYYLVDINNPTLVVSAEDIAASSSVVAVQPVAVEMLDQAPSLSNTISIVPATPQVVITDSVVTEVSNSNTAVFANGETVLVSADSPVVYATTGHSENCICTVPFQEGITFETIGNYGRVGVRDAVYASLAHTKRNELPETATLAVYNNYYVWQIIFVDAYVLVDVDNADSHLVLPISVETTASIGSLPGPIYLITEPSIVASTVTESSTPVEPIIEAVVEPVTEAVVEPVTEVVENNVTNEVSVDLSIGFEVELFFDGTESTTTSSSTNSVYDAEGYDANGYDAEGYNREGYNASGFDREGYDREGYNAEGYDRDGYYKYTVVDSGDTPTTPDHTTYDAEGYDANGYDAEGYNREGYNTSGYDREGYDAEGYNAQGTDRNGYNKFSADGSGTNNTHDTGMNNSMYDAEGYDANGYDTEGYNREGYNVSGYDREGYDAEGYNAEGTDREGYNKYSNDDKSGG